MARGVGSTFDTVLPIGKRRNIGMINWGFVNGKTQTDMPWDSWQRPYTLRPPTLWFHDIFRADGTAYRGREIAIIKRLSAAPKTIVPRIDHFHGVGFGTCRWALRRATEPKSAGETISRYSMSGE